MKETYPDFLVAISPPEKKGLTEEEQKALDDFLGDQKQKREKKNQVSLETHMEFSEWMEEDDRYNRNNPFLSSPDTAWIEDLYRSIYRLSPSPRHRDTFRNIITNLSLRKESIFISLDKGAYKDTHLPSYFVPSKVSEICNMLHRKGYVELSKGHKLPGQAGVATVLEPTEKLLSLIPPGMSYTILEEGLVIPKEFTPDTFPPEILEIKKLLSKYNRTVEPENMLYATHKGSFDVDGRFTGSKVILMPSEDRKNLKINGEDTIELDVSNCLPFLLYADSAGQQLSSDAYDIDGYPRKLAKKGFLKAMNCESRERARKAIQSEMNLNYKGKDANHLLDRLEESHPRVKGLFYSGIGRRLMHLESSCMATFMRSMLDKGIKFYPIYDSVRVPVSKRDIAKEELRKAFTIDAIEPRIHED